MTADDAAAPPRSQAALDAPTLPPIDFSFMQAKDLMAVAIRDYEELRKAPAAASQTRVVLAGSVLEALFMDALEAKAVPRSTTMKLELTALRDVAIKVKALRPQGVRAVRIVVETIPIPPEN